MTDAPAVRRLRLAVLLSGGGRTLQNLQDRIVAGTLPAEIVGVVSSRADAFGVERARRLGLPAHVVSRKAHPDVDSFSRAVWATVDPWRPDLVLLAGFLCMVRVPPAYAGRVLNIHPALLPAFGGKGFYGDRVHRAVLRSGARESGCTVHFVDDQYDHGPVLLQKRVPVLPDDSPDDLAERVFAAECEAYPEALRMLAEGRAHWEEGRVRILPAAQG